MKLSFQSCRVGVEMAFQVIDLKSSENAKTPPRNRNATVGMACRKGLGPALEPGSIQLDVSTNFTSVQKKNSGSIPRQNWMDTQSRNGWLFSLNSCL